jgi:hypothetical protein
LFVCLFDVLLVTSPISFILPQVHGRFFQTKLNLVSLAFERFGTINFAAVSSSASSLSSSNGGGGNGGNRRLSSRLLGVGSGGGGSGGASGSGAGGVVVDDGSSITAAALGQALNELQLKHGNGTPLPREEVQEKGVLSWELGEKLY